MNFACTAITLTGLTVASPFILYAAARLIFTAYFFTREQFNRRARHGTR